MLPTPRTPRELGNRWWGESFICVGPFWRFPSVVEIFVGKRALKPVSWMSGVFFWVTSNKRVLFNPLAWNKQVEILRNFQPLRPLGSEIQHVLQLFQILQTTRDNIQLRFKGIRLKQGGASCGKLSPINQDQY